MADWLRIAPEVRDARAVVALESTIITHGMPYPENLATALALEREVRAVGAVPTTIAVINGAVRVGLAESELEQLASADGTGGDYTVGSLNAEERRILEKIGTEIRIVPFEKGYSTSALVEKLSRLAE